MLGIVVALPWELKSLTRQTLQPGACTSIREDITVALSGIGAERAYAAAALLVSRGATALLGWGYAAALDHRVTAGSVLLPKRIIGLTGESHPVNAEWHRRLCENLSHRSPIYTDALVESAAILKTSSEKRALAEQTQATATDMESAAQARLARERLLPFVVVRAVVDTASTPIPENVMQALDSEGDLCVRNLLSKVLLRPADWIPVAKLGIQFRAAQRTLKETSTLVLNASQVCLEGHSPDATIPSRG